MNFLRALYETSAYDDLISLLKKAFGPNVGSVDVDTIIEDQMLELRWTGVINPNELAMDITQELPNVILETQSDTGIDLYSRYFNGTQLW